MRRPSLLLAAAAFAALAVVVALGLLAGVDQWSTDHLMPGLDVRHSSVPSLWDALDPVGSGHDPLSLAADAWLYPASAPLSGLIVCAATWALWRRRRRVAALLWPAAWFVGDVVEVLTKHTLVRPAISAADGGQRFHVVAFDNSLPSGHTLRSLLVAAAVAAAWPRLRTAAAVWAASVLPVLLVAGWHVPTDIVAGALLAAFFVLLVRELAQQLEARPVDRRAHAAGRRDERQPAAVDAQP